MSFSAEMKDFLNAYKTGQSINASRTDQDYKDIQGQAAKAKMERDNDPETLELAKKQAQATLAATNQRMGLSASARGDASKNAALSRELLQERINDIRAARSGGSGLYAPGAINPGATTQPTPGAPVQGVLPVGPSTLDTGEDAYAGGGLVEESDPAELEGDADADDALPAAAAPTQGVLPTEAAPAGAPTDVSARSRTTGVPRGLEGIISPQLVSDAAREGLTWGIEKAGLHQGGAVKTPSQIRKAQLIAQGAGGLTEPEMAAAKQAVDPEGKLTESQRNMAALGSVYQFWANKGEPDKARRVAFQMMQYYRGASQRYAAIAAKAAEGGNMDLATKAALKAYQNVPDGKDLEIAPNPDGGLMYTYTDEKGDVIAKGIATPQQLAASAMGLATGGFDKALMAAAGAQPAEQGAVKTGGGKTQSAGDRAKEAETVGGEIEKLKADWAKKNEGKPADEEQWSEVSNVAQHIYQQNPKATANEVARAAHAMLSMGDDPEKPAFKVKPGEDGKPNVVDFGGKLKVQLDDDQLNSILNSRAQKVKAATDKINADMEASDKPSTIDKVAQGALDVGRGAAKFVEEGGPVGAIGNAAAKIGSTAYNALKSIYGEHIPQSVIDAVQSTVDEGKARYGSSARNIRDAVTNKGAIPVDEGDRPL